KRLEPIARPSGAKARGLVLAEELPLVREDVRHGGVDGDAVGGLEGVELGVELVPGLAGALAQGVHGFEALGSVGGGAALEVGVGAVEDEGAGLVAEEAHGGGGEGGAVAAGVEVVLVEAAVADLALELFGEDDGAAAGGEQLVPADVLVDGL